MEAVGWVDSGMTFGDQTLYERLQNDMRRRARVGRQAKRRETAERRRLEARLESLLTLLRDKRIISADEMDRLRA